MDWQKKNVVITGAGGFIGGQLTAALLQKKAFVTAFIRYNSRYNSGWLEELSAQKPKNLSVVLCDVRDSNSMRKLVEGSDIVFHLAALVGIPYSYMAPGSYFDTNVNGTYNVLQAALEAQVERIIHTSTSEVYGTAHYVPIDEEHPLQGQSPYAASKISADKLAESYFRSFGLPVVTVRPFNTYGPHQSARAVIPAIITQALSGKNVRLGSLEPVRDMTFVDDTVRGFIAAAESEKLIGETLNLGTGNGVSIRELVEIISSTMKQEMNIITETERTRPAKSEVHKLISCATKANKLMNWKAQIGLQEGLAKTVTWISENKHFYNTTKFAY